jgi:hypothetical protein
MRIHFFSLCVGIQIVAVASLVVTACNKTTSLSSGNVAALNVVNALPTSVPLIAVSGTTGPVVFNYIPQQPQYGNYQSMGSIGSIGYGTNAVLTPAAGNNAFYLAQRNVDTLLNAKGGLSKVMFDSVLNLKGNTVYSLFITGKDTTMPDYLLVQDSLVYHAATDSTTSIRFVNLAANSLPVSINLEGSANGSEVQSLPYKGITNFKSYAATSAISNYLFVVRDATTGDSLTSYNLTGVGSVSNTVANYVRFKNLTIALIGQPTGGVVPQRCVLINNY